MCLPELEILGADDDGAFCDVDDSSLPHDATFAYAETSALPPRSEDLDLLESLGEFDEGRKALRETGKGNA